MKKLLYKWSIEDWHELVASGVLDDKKVELLQGDIVTMSPEGLLHSYTQQSTSDYLTDLLRGKAHIRDAHPITLDDSEPEPDLAIVRLPKEVYLQHHPYAEDIYFIVEIANRSLAKDLGEKAGIYARNKIAEYWVIDLQHKELIVHRNPEGNNYSQIVRYQTGTVSPLAFPDLKLKLDVLLVSSA